MDTPNGSFVDKTKERGGGLHSAQFPSAVTALHSTLPFISVEAHYGMVIIRVRVVGVDGPSERPEVDFS